MGKLRPDGWTHVDDGMPTKKGRYQVAILLNGKYYVTMRKYFPDKPLWRWERCTGGIRYWKPMSDLPNGCEPVPDSPYNRGITLNY